MTYLTYDHVSISIPSVSYEDCVRCMTMATVVQGVCSCTICQWTWVSRRTSKQALLAKQQVAAVAIQDEPWIKVSEAMVLEIRKQIERWTLGLVP